jgi:hypothetical protein
MVGVIKGNWVDLDKNLGSFNPVEKGQYLHVIN